MTGLKQRLLRRSAPGSQGPAADGQQPTPGAGPSGTRSAGKRPKWGKRAAAPVPPADAAAVAPEPVAPAPVATGPFATAPVAPGPVATEVVATADGDASFRDRGRLRRRLRYLRRARELAFRDVGGLIFDLRRFDRERPDLVDAKLAALAAVDQELRALERVLDDKRPIHELREPGLSSCARCGALHASEDNFCPHCGLQIGGPQAMGEVGGAIAAPPQAPAAPAARATAPTLFGPRPPAPPPAAAGPGQPSIGYPHDPQRTEIYRPPDAS